MLKTEKISGKKKSTWHFQANNRMKIVNLLKQVEIVWIPCSSAGRWIEPGRSVFQPGSGISSPPRPKPHGGSPLGSAHTHYHPEDTHKHMCRIMSKDENIPCSAVQTAFSSRIKKIEWWRKNTNTDQVGSSPPLPLQRCCLVMNFSLIFHPAVLCDSSHHMAKISCS